MNSSFSFSFESYYDTQILSRAKIVRYVCSGYAWKIKTNYIISLEKKRRNNVFSGVAVDHAYPLSNYNKVYLGVTKKVNNTSTSLITVKIPSAEG